jgi:hypothetical protein
MRVVSVAGHEAATIPCEEHIDGLRRVSMPEDDKLYTISGLELPVR